MNQSKIIESALLLNEGTRGADENFINISQYREFIYIEESNDLDGIFKNEYKDDTFKPPLIEVMLKNSFSTPTTTTKTNHHQPNQRNVCVVNVYLFINKKKNISYQRLKLNLSNCKIVYIN